MRKDIDQMSLVQGGFDSTVEDMEKVISQEIF